MVYKIVKYVPGSSTPDGQGSLVFQQSAEWHSETGFSPCNGMVQYSPKCHDFTFATADNSLPLDSPGPEVITMYPYFRAVMWFFALVCILMVLTILIVVLVFCRRRICRMAQPGMIVLVCCGLLLACVRVILAAVDISTSSCVGEFWTGHLAFVLVVTTLGVKTWRVFMVTNVLKKVKIAENKCMAIVVGCVCVCVCAFIMVVHSSIGDIHVDQVTIQQDQFEYIKELKCVSRNNDALYALFAVEGIIILLAGRLMWFTKHVASTISSTATSATGEGRALLYSLLFAIGSHADVVFLNSCGQHWRLYLRAVHSTGAGRLYASSAAVLGGRNHCFSQHSSDLNLVLKPRDQCVTGLRPR